MARTISDIKKQMTDSFISNPTIQLNYQLTPGKTFEQEFSVVSIESIFFYACAFGVWVLEKLFDLHTADIEETIANKNPGTARWYVWKAKQFQYGFDLVTDQDYYDNTGLNNDVVAASKIVAYAALVEEPVLRMKVAKATGTDLAPLDATELAAFVEYVQRYKYAGVKLKANSITSTAADKLKLNLRIKYNPLILNSNGERLDGNDMFPVKNAVKVYLKNLDFNGLFSVQKLVDYIQAVAGVEDVAVDQVARKYGALPFTTVDIDFIPDAGYLVIDDIDFAATYIPA